MSLRYWLFVFVIIFTASCIRQVQVPIRDANPYLVVEGAITTDSAPYTIKLSYSGKFTNTYQVSQTPDAVFISDANVTVIDDLGDSTACNWMGNGNYETTDPTFIGQVGRSYFLKIYLSNGKVYTSKPEKIVPVSPIDSITVAYDTTYDAGVRPTQLIVQVNAHDPAGEQNYYRWSSQGYVPRKSVGGPCFFGEPPCTNPFDCTCYAFCEQFLPNSQVQVYSDEFTDGREITKLPVFYSPVYWKGVHYTEVKQYSISQGAYQFYQMYLDQTNRTGSILDPLPASLVGNVYNAADSNDLALGYFSASSVFTKKVKILPNFLQLYLLESIAVYFIADGDCHGAYQNSLEDDTPPTGWDGAEEIDMN